MRFILRNSVNKFMVFDEKTGSLDMMGLIGDQDGGRDDPFTQFLFQFEKGEISQDMCDQIMKALTEGFNKNRFFKPTEWYLGGEGERTVNMQFDEKWGAYLALFYQGPVTVIRTLHESRDISIAIQSVIEKSADRSTNV